MPAPVKGGPEKGVETEESVWYALCSARKDGG